MSATSAPAHTPPATHPSGDNRFKRLEAVLKKNQFRHDALLEVLHTAQELFGYLSEDLLIFIARKMKMPPAKVYGVATFYHYFSLKPKGRHQCVICLGTACYVKGSAALLGAVETLAKIRDGQTTPDGALTVSGARCIGTCGIAPAVVFDGTVLGKVTPELLLKRVKECLADGSR